MKTFNMYVKTVITNEYGQVLILKEKRMDKKTRWDLPETPLTEEQSFDEVVISNIQKEIGYYIYPGKIIGTTSYKEHRNKNLYVIMEGIILNGEILLSDNYENFAWIDITRINEYPLTPWLNNYIKNTKNPFNDVTIEIEEMENIENMRQEIIQEEIITDRNKKSKRNDNSQENITKGIKGSLGLLKDTIIKTFHPKKAKITKTEPKNNLFSENNNKISRENYVMDKLNIKSDDYEEEIEFDNITVEHENENNIYTNNEVNNNPDEEVIITDENDIVSETMINPNKNQIENEQNFNMNINHQNNIKTEIEKPKIKIISKEDKIPHIRKEKESNEKISFNSEGIKRHGWKEKLNDLNRTDTNNRNKKIPHPKGNKRN